MFLKKREALTVAKVLAIHNQSLLCSGTGDLQREVDALQDRVEGFLIDDEDAVTDHEVGADEEEEGDGTYGFSPDEEEGEEDEKAADDDEAEEDPAGEEDEEDDEGEGEDGEPSEEDDDEAEEAEYVVARSDLFYLGLKTAQGQLSFKEDGDEVNLCVDDRVEMNNVTHMKRFGKELHVRDSEGEWEVYDVKRFSKAWTDLLPLQELVEIE